MNRFLPHIALFAVALIYGANYTIAKEVLDNDYIQPRGFILMRAGAGMLLFWLVNIGFLNEKIQRQHWKVLILCSIFGVAINQICFFTGLKYTQPIHASLIMLTTPILVLIIGAIILREKITKIKTFGIALGLAGAALILTAGKSIDFQSEQLFGDLMIFINAASYGIYLVLVRKLMRIYHPLTVMTWVFTFGFIWVIPFGLGEFRAVDWSAFTPGIWASVGYVLLFTTFFAYLLNAYALKKVSATVVSIYIYLQPIIATAIAISYGSDELSFEKIIAATLIFTGVFLVSKK